MSFVKNIRQGDSFSMRFTLKMPKPNVQIWAEGAGQGGIVEYWADYKTWVAAARGNESEEAFLEERAPDVSRIYVPDLTGWTPKMDLRDGGNKIADLDVRFEAQESAGFVLSMTPAFTATLQVKTYASQLQLSKDDRVLSGAEAKFTVIGDITK